MARHGENIRKRKDGRWEGRYKVFDERRGRYIYRSVYGSAYGEVKEKLSKAKFELSCRDNGKSYIQKNTDFTEKTDGTDIVVLFSQAAEEWLMEIAGKRKHSTYIKYNTVYQLHLVGVIGSCQLAAGKIPEIQEKIFDHLSEKILSESLQKSIFCIANQILDFANRKYFVNVLLLKRPATKPKKRTVETFSKAEQAKIFSCIYDGTDKFKAAMLLCLYTGLRLGEICALKWTDINEKNLTLTVNSTVQRISVQGGAAKTILLETEPKSEHSKRLVPLTSEIIKMLIQFQNGQSYVFGGYKPLDPRTMQYRFKKILETAGVDQRNFHILRHTFATNCIESGMDIKALSEILGHSDVKITLNRYVHPTMDLKRKQIEGLPDFNGQICGQAA